MVKKIICTPCGEMADIFNQSGSDKVICYHCGRKTEFVEYRKKLDNRLDEFYKKLKETANKLKQKRGN